MKTVEEIALQCVVELHRAPQEFHEWNSFAGRMNTRTEVKLLKSALIGAPLPSKQLNALTKARSEINRLQRRLNLFRFALEEICDVSKRDGYTDKDRAVCSFRIAQEALNQ